MEITRIATVRLTNISEVKDESEILNKDVAKKRITDALYDAIYNKAIDDFVKEICKMIIQSEKNGNYRFYAVEIKQAIVDLAEQLKAGAEE